jgi:hypothetical protein
MTKPRGVSGTPQKQHILKRNEERASRHPPYRVEDVTNQPGLHIEKEVVPRGQKVSTTSPQSFPHRASEDVSLFQTIIDIINNLLILLGLRAAELQPTIEPQPLVQEASEEPSSVAPPQEKVEEKISLEGTPLEHLKDELQDVLKDKSELSLFQFYNTLREEQKKNPQYSVILEDFKLKIEGEIGTRYAAAAFNLQNALPENAKKARDARLAIHAAKYALENEKSKLEEVKLSLNALQKRKEVGQEIFAKNEEKARLVSEIKQNLGNIKETEARLKKVEERLNTLKGLKERGISVDQEIWAKEEEKENVIEEISKKAEILRQYEETAALQAYPVNIERSVLINFVEKTIYHSAFDAFKNADSPGEPKAFVHKFWEEKKEEEAVRLAGILNSYGLSTPTEQMEYVLGRADFLFL